MKNLFLTALCIFAGLVSYAQNKKSADLSLNVIAIDAGHGGKDVGTVSQDKKTYEKTITLSLAQKFSKRIREEYPAMKVVMTRDKDEFIELNRRAKIATNAGAQLFISIHVNATAKGKTANGFSAYILGTSDRYNSYDVNMEVCKRENSVIQLEDDYTNKYKDLDDSSPESQIFLKLMQNAFREQSLAFAEACCNKMAAKGPFKKDMGVLQGNFAVLRQASMPAVLLEFGYMTNDNDLATLRNSDDIDRMVENMVSAFKEYKNSYDQSVRLGGESAAPAETTKPEAKPAQPAAETKKPAEAGEKKTAETPAASGAKAEGETFYGLQVLASSKKMSASDKFFRGHEMKAVPSGSLYKYILCPDSDLPKAREKAKQLKTQFPDAFLVKVENGEISRVK